MMATARSSATLERLRLGRLRLDQPLLWLIPLFVGAAGYVLSVRAIAAAVGGLVALVILIFMMRRPAIALITLVIFLPLQNLGYGILYGLHVSGSILRPAGSLKEILGISILLAAAREIHRRRPRLDGIDKVVLAYLGIVTAYLIVPHLFAAGAPSEWNVRLLAWRSDCGYVLIFFAVRHAPMAQQMKRRFTQVLIAMGTLVAFVALFQEVASATWTHFVLFDAHQYDYQIAVLHNSPQEATSSLAYLLNTSPLRVSSVFFSPFDMADYLVLVIAVVGDQLSVNRRRVSLYIPLVAMIAAIFFSRVRADALAAVIVLALVALPTPRRPVESRIRFIGALVIAGALIVPALGGTRFVGAQGGSASDTGHITEIEGGLYQLATTPLGLGLGNQPATESRFTLGHVEAGKGVSDNSITQVGDELGLQTLLPWLVLLALVLLTLRRRAKGGDDFAAGMGLGLLGVLIAGQYHHVFISFPVPWTLWAGLGLALSARRLEPPHEDLEDTVSRPAPAGLVRSIEEPWNFGDTSI